MLVDMLIQINPGPYILFILDYLASCLFSLGFLTNI
jgi:hypothetical protein